MTDEELEAADRALFNKTRLAEEREAAIRNDPGVRRATLWFVGLLGLAMVGGTLADNFWNMPSHFPGVLLIIPMILSPTRTLNTHLGFAAVACLAVGVNNAVRRGSTPVALTLDVITLVIFGIGWTMINRVLRTATQRLPAPPSEQAEVS